MHEMKVADIANSLPHTTSQVTHFTTVGGMWPALPWLCWQGGVG